MSSRRRNSKKNLGTNLSDIQRRLRRMERKPIRTRLQNRVIKGAAIAPSSITADEVGFGTNIVADLVGTETPQDLIANPKAGDEVTDRTTGKKQVYDPVTDTFIDVKDPAAQASADGKNTIYRQDSQPSGGTYVTGDVWFDTDDDNKIYRYSSATSTWVGFTLGDNALGTISANKIVTGTLDAALITVSNLDAGKISAGTLTGSTVRTAASGRRVEVAASNQSLSFYNASNTLIGNIRPADDVSGLIISGGDTATSFATTAHPKLYMAPSGTDGQFTLIVNSAGGGLEVKSASGIMSALIGVTNTAAVNPYGQRSLREIGLGSATTYPDLSSVTSITGVEGFIVLTYS
jgi:hypothetical protein